jgi:choline kinase
MVLFTLVSGSYDVKGREKGGQTDTHFEYYMYRLLVRKAFNVKFEKGDKLFTLFLFVSYCENVFLLKCDSIFSQSIFSLIL